MNKTLIVLKMYDMLQNGEEVRMDDWCAKYDISVSTFRRYVSMLREYCWEEHRMLFGYNKQKECYEALRIRQ